MKQFATYKDLDVWIEARKLVGEIYTLTAKFPREEVFGLTNQMRRAAVSVLSNIAEGCGRGTSRGTVAFLFVARGSLYEVETQCVIAFDLKYIDSRNLESISERITSCKRLLNGLIRHHELKVDQTSNR